MARTHTEVTYANPYYKCGECREFITGHHHWDQCGVGCEAGDYLVPCRHKADYYDGCPNWNPVDGCNCGGTHKYPVL